MTTKNGTYLNGRLVVVNIRKPVMGQNEVVWDAYTRYINFEYREFARISRPNSKMAQYGECEPTNNYTQYQYWI